MRDCTRFLAKFAPSIVARLSWFDRMIFKGYLPFGSDEHLNSWVDGLGLKRKDFLPLVERMSIQLVEQAKSAATSAGAPYHYFQGHVAKERLIDGILRERPAGDGLIAVLCVQETCRTVKLRYGEDRPRLEFAYRPQRVLYYYYLDPNFGRIYVRIQTWFPFTIQVYVNGHDWLARQMTQRKLGFVQRDNCFTQLDQPQAAQKLADRFPALRWRGQLNRWAQGVNPLLRQSSSLIHGAEYRWVVDQAEYSTDVIWASPEKLADLYPRLLDHAAVNFSAQDILTFLGRRMHPRFEGEVLNQCQKGRHPGARIKHRMKDNWLKMYDKFGQMLRVETVINNPREFKVRRQRERGGQQKMVWCPMNKGIANLYQYRACAHAANMRYLNALAVVADPTPAYQHVGELVRTKQVAQRRVAGFNPARREDVQLFRAILRGEHAIKGFRNADIRRLYFPEAATPPDPVRRRRQSAKLCRQFHKLQVRGLLAKIPHTRRWLVTPRGHQLLGTCVQLYYHGLATAA
jgi:hypothetical protein